MNDLYIITWYNAKLKENVVFAVYSNKRPTQQDIAKHFQVNDHYNFNITKIIPSTLSL